MTTSLTGKAALVIGGSRGIGAAIAIRLAAEGANVALTYANSPKKAEAVVASIVSAGGRAVALRADSGDPAAVKKAVADASRRSDASISWSTVRAWSSRTDRPGHPRGL
jgi:3-oxoacyl-[acyl-carrier protein] reductase